MSDASRCRPFIFGCLASIFGLFAISFVFSNSRSTNPRRAQATAADNGVTFVPASISSDSTHKSAKTSKKSTVDKGEQYSLELTKPRSTPASAPADLHAQLFAYPLQPSAEKVCKFASNASLPIIFVKSTVSEFLERQIVRETWGAAAANLNISVIFLVGLPSNVTSEDEKANSKARQESLTYADLLMGDYADIYDHMPLKTLSMLYWYTEIAQKLPNCTSKRLLFSTDTDCMVFPDNLYRLTRKLTCFEAENTIGGHCWSKAPVKRDIKDKKHYVSKKLWPAEMYPPYCSGSGFVLTHDVPAALLKAIPVQGKSAILKWIEGFEHLNDVLYTGVLRLQAKVKIHNEPGSFHWNQVGSVDKCDHHFISSHDFKPPSRLRDKWREFRANFMKNCTIRNEW